MKLEELRGKDTFEARAVLEALTVKELKEICKEHHRRGYSHFRKYQLVNELMMACCDEFLLSDLNGAKRESADTATENQSKTQEDTTKTKKTIKEAIKAVQAATTADEVKTALLGFTKGEMSIVYMEVTGAPFCAWSSRISEVERADSLAVKLMKYKQFGIRQIG